MKPLFLLLPFVSAALGQDLIGLRGKVGVLDNPRKVERLVIDKPGAYENYLVDSGREGGNLVKVTCDDVIIRNCEIRNATGNGIGCLGFGPKVERKCHMVPGGVGEGCRNTEEFQVAEWPRVLREEIPVRD